MRNKHTCTREKKKEVRINFHLYIRSNIFFYYIIKNNVTNLISKDDIL